LFEDRLLGSFALPNQTNPLISVAIPHYRNRPYLEIVLQSIFDQDFQDFEIVVSNDHSPDDSDEVVPDILRKSGRAFAYYSQPQNLGYDGNVRFCLAAAHGRYVLLLGNDDALGQVDTLTRVATALQELDWPEVAFTNYADWESGQVVQTAVSTRILGSGTSTALKFFRSFSFVSGLIFDRLHAAEHNTDRWDKSIYYQIYLGCRIVAANGRLGALNINTVKKDVRIEGKTVPNYATKWGDSRWNFSSHHTGIDSVTRVTWDAVQPYVPLAKQSGTARGLITEVLVTLYPFWILEYRRIAHWSLGVGVARSHWPGLWIKEYKLSLVDRIIIWLIYFFVTSVALILPIGLFTKSRKYVAYGLRKIKQAK
jgi:glycosyltransferase involved in cell wall biosynthesis